MPVIASGVPMAEAAPARACALMTKRRPFLLICQVDSRKEGYCCCAQELSRLAEATGAAVALEIVIPGKEVAGGRTCAGRRGHGGIGTDGGGGCSFAGGRSAVLPGSAGGSGPTLKEIYAAARAAFPGVTLGGGMFSYFTELNRKPPPGENLDYLTHTTCPIVHAADDISVMETLEAVPYVIKSAKASPRVRPIISARAIPARDNPYGARRLQSRRWPVCLADMDPRQRGLFAAAWTLVSLRHLPKACRLVGWVGAVTGPQGMIYRKTDYAQPGFDGGKAAVYPLYHVVAGLAPAAGAKRIVANWADP